MCHPCGETIGTNIKRHTIPRSAKNAGHETKFAADKNVEVKIVATIRFINVATLIAFARIVVENTSEGISHAPGPIPKEKKLKYIANATMITPAPLSPPTSKVNETINKASVIPIIH
jgi:hypothetical protein